MFGNIGPPSVRRTVDATFFRAESVFKRSCVWLQHHRSIAKARNAKRARSAVQRNRRTDASRMSNDVVLPKPGETHEQVYGTPQLWYPAARKLKRKMFLYGDE